jgi:hypothetical protein
MLQKSASRGMRAGTGMNKSKECTYEACTKKGNIADHCVSWDLALQHPG